MLLVGPLMVTAAAVALLLRSGIRFRTGVTAALTVCVALGLAGGSALGGGIGLRDGGMGIPWVFDRGLYSVAVWAALGTSAVIAAVGPRRTRAPGPDGRP